MTLPPETASTHEQPVAATRSHGLSVRIKLVGWWVAFAYFWLLPLVLPRGPWLQGRFSYLDIYLGIPIGIGALCATLIAFTPKKRRRQFAVRLTAVVVSSVAAVFVCDVAIAFWRSAHWEYWFDYHGAVRNGNRSDAELGFVRAPNLSLDWQPASGRKFVYRTDENGFRNPTGVKTADVAFIGDSFTEANEVPESERFSDRLTRAGFKTVNLGRSSYGPPQELIVLERYALKYRPKFIVWQVYEGNDLQDTEEFEHWRQNRRATEDKVRPHGIVGNYLSGSGLARWLRSTRPNAYPNARLRYAGGATAEFAFVGDSYYIRDVAATFPLGFRTIEKSIESGQAICRRNGIQLIVMFIPLRYRVLAPYLEYEAQKDHDRLMKAMAERPFTDLNARLEQICTKAGCKYINMYPVLRDKAAVDTRGLYQLYDTHLDTVGHELVAAAILSQLGEPASRQSANLR